jgi:ubiquinone/menaquinone biosynthesis C-methylase UbiE
MNGIYNARWVQEFYDAYGDKEWGRMVKDPVHEVKLHVHRHYLEEFIRRGDRVLEVGAGPGRFTQILAELGASVVVADVSQVQLELNRKHAEEVGFGRAVTEWVRLDVCDLAVFADETFDGVVCYGGPLSYVFEKRRQAAGEALRVLKAGGVALFSVMSLWGAVHQYLPGVVCVSPGENARIIETGDLCPETFAACTHRCHMFTAGELRTLFQELGAQVLAISASNCLSAAWGDRLAEVRNDPAKWAQLLDMELRACREPGCVDMGEHMIAVVRKMGPDRR